MRVDRLPHRKWKQIKQQPGTAGPGNMLGCCLICFHFMWGKLSTRTVLRVVDLGVMNCGKTSYFWLLCHVFLPPLSAQLSATLSLMWGLDFPCSRRRRSCSVLRGQSEIGDGVVASARYQVARLYEWSSPLARATITVICGYSDTFLTGLNCSRT